MRPLVNISGGKGQIGIVRTHGFSSWLIRLITRAKVNHCIIDTGTDLISAEYPVVRRRPYGHFTNIIWSQFDLTTKTSNKIIDFATNQIGKPYGVTDDIAIGVGIIFHDHTPGTIMRHLSSDGQWICSELADASLRHGGIHIWNDNRPTGAVFPGSFENFYRDAGWLPKHILFSKRT